MEHPSGSAEGCFDRTLRMRSRQHGFTLIELLVVIAIILILIAIALPNFLSAQARAKNVHCKSNLRVLGQALFTYRIDYNRFPPADGCGGDDPSPDHTCLGQGPAALGSWDGVPWVLHDLGYVEDRDVFFCPVLRGHNPERKDHCRYAYNSSAADTGIEHGGANHFERDSGNLWLCRCVWVPAEASFHPESGLIYPHGNDLVEYDDDLPTLRENAIENVLRIDNSVESCNGWREFYGYPTGNIK